MSLSDRDARGCALVGALDAFVEKLDESPGARSLHYLAGRLYSRPHQPGSLHPWVSEIRLRFDALQAACFTLGPGKSASVVTDPQGASGHALAVAAMNASLEDCRIGAAAIYSSGLDVDVSPGHVRVSGAAVRCSGDRVLGIVVMQAADSVGDESAVVEYLAALTWHLKCADDAHRSTAPRPAALDAADLVEILPLPCMLTDDSGRALERNQGFNDFMSSVGIYVATGRLRFNDRYLQDSWQLSLHEVHATAVRQSMLAAGDDGRLWRVHLVPVHGTLGETEATKRPMILAIVEREAAPADVQLDSVLPETSRPLTTAEGEVLSALLQGHSAKVIANARGASVNTVRSQIMTILGKTGFHNQRSLIAAVGNSAFRNSVSPRVSPPPRPQAVARR